MKRLFLLGLAFAFALLSSCDFVTGSSGEKKVDVVTEENSENDKKIDYPPYNHEGMIDGKDEIRAFLVYEEGEEFEPGAWTAPITGYIYYVKDGIKIPLKKGGCSLRGWMVDLFADTDKGEMWLTGKWSNDVYGNIEGEVLYNEDFENSIPFYLNNLETLED